MYISHKFCNIYHDIYAIVLTLLPILILKGIEYPATPQKMPDY